MRQGQKEVISFVGPPGSGKGTIAQQWQEESNVEVLSTGDLCRKHVREQTPFGKEFSQHLAAGNLIPDELITRMVREWLIENSTTNDHIVLDGYPRTAPQVGDWAQMMADDLSSFMVRVVLFELPDQVIIDRLSQRMVCPHAPCQAVYTAVQQIASCVECGHSLVRRPDDEPDVIKKRLALYATHKAALLDAYRSVGITIETFNVEHIALNDMFTQFDKLLLSQSGA